MSGSRSSDGAGCLGCLWVIFYLPLLLLWTVVVAFTTPRESGVGQLDLDPPFDLLVNLAIFAAWIMGAWVLGRVLYRMMFAEQKPDDAPVDVAEGVKQ